LAELVRLVPAGSTVLEIASGTGQHAAHFAAEGPGWTWIATDPDPENLASIQAWQAAVPAANLHGPHPFDVHEPWAFVGVDAVFCANMIHIAPWSATQALIRGAASVLGSGPLVLYGPFLRAGVDTAPSNLAFDASLRERDAAHGIRHLERVDTLANEHGFRLHEVVEMPANNLIVVWTR
jgi:SAM-dependent methyltransferase